MRRRIVLLGATGTFGSRLAGLLAAMPEVEIVLAARRVDALRALKRRLEAAGSRASFEFQCLDRATPAAIADLAPWLVLDAAGPFQGAGFDVARAAMEAGAHYIDLADGRDFVAGFPAALNDAAARAGVLAVTGASSTPALSQAALATLVDGWQLIDDVVVAISPGARAPRGLAVMQAILSYAGRPVRLFRDGQWTQAAGWSATRQLDMPGLGRRFASLCETPDLDLLPARFPIRRSALFLAGLELPVMHLGLALLSLPVRLGLVRSLHPLASGLRRVADWLAPLGSDRGGMIVSATGRDAAGRAIRARWALWAEAGAGPTTPAAPAAALVRALFEGRITEIGARHAAGLLDLDAILHELAPLPIFTRADAGWPAERALFRRLLGPRFEELPASVRAVHGTGCTARFHGKATARAGRGLAAVFLRRVLGLPRTGLHAAEVTIVPSGAVERWTRRFGAAAFATTLRDTGRLGIFEEHFGPLAFAFDLRPIRRGVRWELVGWRLGPIPLPRALAPLVRAGAEDEDGRYRFRVLVAHRWLGLLLAYCGDLAP